MEGRTSETLSLLTLSYSSKINVVLFLHQVGCDSPLQIVMAAWRTLLNLNLLGWVWQPHADYTGCLAHFKFKKSLPNGHYYLQRAVTLTRSLSRIVSRGQEGPKAAAKGLWRPHFQANIWPRVFFMPMSPQETGRRLWGNPGTILIYEHCEGRGALCWTRKGLNRLLCLY
jgi:hypothetical protein